MASRSAAHSPAVKDHANTNPLRSGRGLGAPRPQRERLTTPALPGVSVPVLYAQCLLPTSTDGQDRTPPRQRRGRVGEHINGQRNKVLVFAVLRKSSVFRGINGAPLRATPHLCHGAPDFSSPR
jgi:hypothetical protein